MRRVFLWAILAYSWPAYSETYANRLFHVIAPTYGCKNPRATRALANKADYRQGDPNWIAYVVSDGQCVQVTGKSVWSADQLIGDLTIATYQGSSAPRDYFYIKTSDLFDNNGLHPNELPHPIKAQARQDRPPEQQNRPTNGVPKENSAPTIRQNLTAEAPASESTVPSHVTEDSTASTLPLNEPDVVASDAAQVPPGDTISDASRNGNSTATSPQITQDSSANDSVSAPIVSLSKDDTHPDGSGAGAIWLALTVGFLIGAAIWRNSVVRERRKKDQLAQNVASEIAKNQMPLRVNRLQKIQTDEYGTTHYDKWLSEKARYIQTRILPIVSASGVRTLKPDFWVQVDAAVELAAQAAPGEIDVSGLVKFASDPEKFDSRMDPLDYELYCAGELRKAGWDARTTAKTGDQGADIIAERSGTRLVVQCKLYSSPVGNDAVQQVHAARDFQGAKLAVVVSNQPFTRSAKDLARVNQVRLMHHEELRFLR